MPDRSEKGPSSSFHVTSSIAGSFTIKEIARYK